MTMDSMRSLNTSLPSAPANNNNNNPHQPPAPAPEPPEELLQAFKTAALSVTTLYKNSVRGQAHARHQGYQEALEDVRAFLDRERLALDTFQGAKIRHWLNERIDGTASPESDRDAFTPDYQNRRESRTEGAASTQVHPHHTTDISPPAFTFSAGGPSFSTYASKEHNGGNTEDLVMQLDGENTSASASASASAASTANTLAATSVFDPANIPASFTSSASSYSSATPPPSASAITSQSTSNFDPSQRHTRNWTRYGNNFNVANDNSNSNEITVVRMAKIGLGMVGGREGGSYND
ncbi:hypothetical protein AAP_05502 [Ascosphaera apis ARSEF 7405]|uniref:Uncharacterized protein n=1 Tax=Ascosphaera apis ARSEF 7405 TaxID=392613 RepID=A0A167VIW8_9EURO|nr:hypothetical protein AAP_05502 [Ascosphaera apis ARSEF 7405]